MALESANKKALSFLYEGGRTVVDCAPTFGHTLEPDTVLVGRWRFLYRWHSGSRANLECV